jgi:hypothetical protein
MVNGEFFHNAKIEIEGRIRKKQINKNSLIFAKMII